jgi:hypothetical protein
MEQSLKILHKLLDNFIIPKFEEIYDYKITPRGHRTDAVTIEFWMDGTEQELEEEIVDECKNLLKYYGLSNIYIWYKFTTGGENYYEYT